MAQKKKTATLTSTFLEFLRRNCTVLYRALELYGNPTCNKICLHAKVRFPLSLINRGYW